MYGTQVAKLYLIEIILNMKRYLFFPVFFVIIIIFSTSCTQKMYKEYNLFQKGLDSLPSFNYTAPLIQNNDRLAIKIFSATLNQEQASVFGMAGTPVSNSNGYSVSGGNNFVVDFDGYISFPIIGNIKCAGFTTDQIDSVITKKLEKYVKDPEVAVSLANFKVNILGEVGSQGTKQFTIPNPTIIDLIAQSGGFSERATRNNVYLIREINGKRTTYTINFNEVSLFNSEVYQLAQNDLVYVPADKIRLKNVYQNPDLQKNLQNLSIVTACLSVISVLFNTYYLFKGLK